MRIKPVQSLLIWGIAIFFAVQTAVGQNLPLLFGPVDGVEFCSIG